MLKKFINENKATRNYDKLSLFDISEKGKRSEFIDYLATLITQSYRDIDFLKEAFSGETKEALFKYLSDEVFPEGEDLLTRNVKKGDWGEILTTDLIKQFENNMIVPFNKLMWKLNRQKSMFCTDVFAHNNTSPISLLKYYEVKTYTSKRKDLGVFAHNSLLKDQESGQQAIADMLSRKHFENGKLLEDAGNENKAKEHFKIGKDYNEIVRKPESFEQEFEIVLIREKGSYVEDELNDLNNLPPKFSPMHVTLFLVDNLDNLIKESFTVAFEKIWKEVNGS